MSESGLRVAVTGPTGDIGRAVVRLLDETPEVERVVGMARRPFDPAGAGLSKFEFHQGDILDRDAVTALVKEADAVVHLAFLIFGSQDETRRVNLEGSRNVFEASLGRARRLVYTSSVAAYGFRDDHPALLTESIPARGSDDHYYSAQKAELEKVLVQMARGTSTDVYVFRPCVVAGPTALALIEQIPFIKIGEKLPAPVKKVVGSLPLLRPVIPDPGVPFQVVHEDDVARAVQLAVVGAGEPGFYNLAAEGAIGFSELAHALGWYALPVPEIALDATASIVSRMPLMPARAAWVNAIRVPMLMDCTKAREGLGWKPEHDALDTLAATVTAARERGLLPWPGRD